MIGLHTNQFDEAQRWFDDAPLLSRKLNYEYGIARVLHNLSLLYRERGEFELYLSSIESSRIFQRIGGFLWGYPMAKLQTTVMMGNRSGAREALETVS